MLKIVLDKLMNIFSMLVLDCLCNHLDTICSIYRPVLLQYGIWDQIRVDQGKEWVLMLFVQEQLAHFRRNTGRNPHVQTTSKQVGNKNYIMWF